MPATMNGCDGGSGVDEEDEGAATLAAAKAVTMTNMTGGDPRHGDDADDDGHGNCNDDDTGDYVGCDIGDDDDDDGDDYDDGD